MRLKKIISWLFGIRYRYRLPVYYIISIALGWSTMLIPPLNECSGGIFVFCLPLSAIVIILLGLPGFWILNSLRFLLPASYYSWATHSENLTSVLIIEYAVGLMFLFLIGLVVDKLRKKK